MIPQEVLAIVQRLAAEDTDVERHLLDAALQLDWSQTDPSLVECYLIVQLTGYLMTRPA